MLMVGFVCDKTIIPSLYGAYYIILLKYNYIMFMSRHMSVTTAGAENTATGRLHLQLLCVKPGGAEHTRFFDQIPRLWQEHISNTQGRERKNALMLLSEIVSDGNRDVCEEAIELAAENGRIDTDSIRQCYYMITKKEYRPAPLLIADMPSLNYSPDLSAYDALVNGGKHNG